MDQFYAEFIDGLSDNIQGEESDFLMDTVRNYFELLNLALMMMQYDLYMYEGILEFGPSWKDLGAKKN